MHTFGKATNTLYITIFSEVMPHHMRLTNRSNFQTHVLIQLLIQRTAGESTYSEKGGLGKLIKLDV